MGKVMTPVYRVEYRTNKSAVTPGSWRRENGRPTVANLEKHVAALNKSFLHDGVNAHVSQALGYILYTHAAKIVHQKSGRVVVEWNAPAFQIV